MAAIGSKTPATDWSAASAPPTMMVKVPVSAAAAPPEMPASRYSAPRSARAACNLMVEPGAAVLRSTMTWPGRQLASTPAGPSTTGSMTELSGSDMSTQSLPVTTAATESAGIAPAAPAFPATGS